MKEKNKKIFTGYKEAVIIAVALHEYIRTTTEPFPVKGYCLTNGINGGHKAVQVMHIARTLGREVFRRAGVWYEKGTTGVIAIF